MGLIRESVGERAGGIAGLLGGYAPLPGMVDEMMAPDGSIRAHWQPFLSMLAELGGDEIGRRSAAADRHLRDSGVFYRVYEDPSGTERTWPLNHLPLLLSAADWKQLEAGLVERAELLETVLDDVYGRATLVRDGRLPAALIAGNPEFLRPLAGVTPPGGAHLRFVAFDLGRGADGRWWVLSDRAQAPSGAGYALENRLAMGRGWPDVYRKLRVERLAPFFQAFRAELSSLCRHDQSRVCLLTPGSMNETYFEHAYLARYLGLLLVEGEDLTVRDDGVFIRTVSGLQRAEVLLRRLDADFADPLELNIRSRLGVPGLVTAVRDGKVVITNALGAGLVEARAMLAFLPALARVLLGTEPLLPNIATWWLGDATLRDEVLSHLDKLMIAPAFSGNSTLSGLDEGALGSSLEPEQRERLMRDMSERGIDYVAQEPVTLSTMPVWNNGRLEPRPFILRLFAARTDDGWIMMPGGFVRVAGDAGARAVDLQKGAHSADACVLSDRPVAEFTLLPTPERISIKRATGVLPSRAADNLLWVGRYVERAEAMLRLVRALVNRIAEADESSARVIRRISALLNLWSAGPSDIPDAKAVLIARAALTRADLDGALPRLAGAARGAASVIRDRFSPDAWEALTSLVSLIGAPLPAGPAESAMLDRADAALRIISSFAGLARENMTQLAGWRFLELGRRIERGITTSRFVRQFADVQDNALDVLLELADSQITYRQRYVMVTARAPVIDLVVLDPNNPRAVAHQVDRIEEHLAALPRHSAEGRLSPGQQVALSLATRLRTTDASAVDDPLVLGIERDLMHLAELIAEAYLGQTEHREPVWEALA